MMDYTIKKGAEVRLVKIHAVRKTETFHLPLNTAACVLPSILGVSLPYTPSVRCTATAVYDTYIWAHQSRHTDGGKVGISTTQAGHIFVVIDYLSKYCCICILQSTCFVPRASVHSRNEDR